MSYYSDHKEAINARRRELRQNMSPNKLEKRRQDENEAVKRHYQKNKEEIKAKARAKHYENKEENNKRSREYSAAHKEENNIRARRYRENRRNQIFSILGDKCIRCGFKDKRALQIDHVNGGGTKERRSYGNRLDKHYKDVFEAVKNGSKEYQILCANCNSIKRYEERST